MAFMVKIRYNENKTRSLNMVNMLPIIGLVVYYYTHYLEGTYSFFIPLGLTFLWLVITLFTGRTKGLFTNKVSLWWMAYLLICVVMVVIGLSSTNLNFVISRLPIFLIPVIGYYVIKNYNKREKVFLLITFFIVFFANLAYNIFLGFQLPEIFEEQESTEASIELSVMMNIATTGFIVVGYWLIGTLLMCTNTIKGKGWKLLYIVLTIPIAYYMLFQNTRGTAILLLIIELILFLLATYEPKKKENRRVYYLISMGIVITVGLVFFIPFMSWLMEQLQSERLADRFNDLVDFQASGGNLNNVREGSLTERFLLAQTSLNSFLSSPLSIMIGIGDHTQAFGGDLVKSGIGGHSEFIDVLARYGLVGAFVFWNIIKSYYGMLKKLITNRDILKYVNVVFVIILLSGFLNNIFQPNMLLFIYLVFPIILELTDRKIAE